MEIPFLPEISRPKNTPAGCTGAQGVQLSFPGFHKHGSGGAGQAQQDQAQPQGRVGGRETRNRPLSPYGVNNSFMACFLTYMSLSASSKTFRREEWRS